MEKGKAFYIKAPAKINLSLLMTGARGDGYHLISSVMQLVSLYDTIAITKNEKPGVFITSTFPQLPLGEKNTCYKAARAYFEAAGLSDVGLNIHIIKKIPEGAGLGGGSSDAAAVLKGMERLFGAFGDDTEKLCELALSVGADVPFCLKAISPCCLCEGIGELMTPVFRPRAYPAVFAVIAKNTRGLSTPAVYAEYDRLKTCVSEAGSDKNIHNERLIRAVSSGSAAEIASLLKNELYNAASSLRPEISSLIQALLDNGAFGASMSGSGSAVFGIFGDERSASECKKKLREDHIMAFSVSFLK